MAVHRFFLSGPMREDGVAPLSPEDVHHARDVVRLRQGETIALVEPSGAVITASAQGFTAEGLGVHLIERMAPDDRPRLTLVAGLLKKEMDLLVEKATELGVSRIVPLISERVVSKEPGTAKRERWGRVAEAAAKQSQRPDIPAVEAPVGLDELSSVLASSAVRVVLWEDALASPGLSRVLRQAGVAKSTSVALVVGPEGGFTPEEVEALREQGCYVASLGSGILRAETAALAACAVALDVMGWLGGGDDCA